MRTAGYTFSHKVHLNDSRNKQQLLSYKTFSGCFQYKNNVLCEVRTLCGLRIM